VATISRLLKMIGLFCRILSLLWVSFAKETYHFKEPTNRSHPIRLYDHVMQVETSLSLSLSLSLASRRCVPLTLQSHLSLADGVSPKVQSYIKSLYDDAVTTVSLYLSPTRSHLSDAYRDSINSKSHLADAFKNWSLRVKFLKTNWDTGHPRQGRGRKKIVAPGIPRMPEDTGIQYDVTSCQYCFSVFH